MSPWSWSTGWQIRYVGELAGAARGVPVVFVRPRLTRRATSVLATGDVPRSRAHLTYVVLEMIKVLALSVAGIALLV